MVRPWTLPESTGLPDDGQSMSGSLASVAAGLSSSSDTAHRLNASASVDPKAPTRPSIRDARADDANKLLEQISLQAASTTKRVSSDQSTSFGHKRSAQHADRLELQRAHIVKARRLNTQQQVLIRHQLENLSAAYSELLEAESRLTAVEELEAKEGALLIKPLNTGGSVTLPYQPELTEKISILRDHSEQYMELRAMLAINTWHIKDCQRLRDAVKAQCQRSHSYRLTAAGVADPLGVVARMDAIELLAPATRVEGMQEAIDWEEVARSTKMHTAAECRTRWLMVERPDINVEPWTQDEQRHLSAVVDKGKAEGWGTHWERIALTMANGRTGAQCLMAFQRMKADPNGVPWTADEDEALIHYVRIFGPRWALIADRLGTARSAQSVQTHYVNTLEPVLRRGRWTEEEDSALRSAMEIVGRDTRDWKTVATHVKTRTAVQCRERWGGRLSDLKAGQKVVKSKPWTEAEDIRLRECIGKNWTWVKVAGYVGGRSDKQVRERWVALQKKAAPAMFSSERGTEPMESAVPPSSNPSRMSALTAHDPKPNIQRSRKRKAANELSDREHPSTSNSSSQAQTHNDATDSIEQPFESSFGGASAASAAAEPPTAPAGAVKRIRLPSKARLEMLNLECPECPWKFKHPKRLRNHLREVHGMEIEEPPTIKRQKGKVPANMMGMDKRQRSAHAMSAESKTLPQSGGKAKRGGVDEGLGSDLPGSEI